MKKLLHLLLMLLMIMIIASPMTFAASPASAAVVPSYTDLSLGDSIAYGMSATPGNGYVDLLHKHLLTIPADSQLSLNNLAVPGDKSSDLLTKLQTPEYVAAVTNAKVITLSIGGNNLLSPVIEKIATTFGVNPDDPNLLTKLEAAMAINPNKDVLLAGIVNSPSLGLALQAGITQFGTDFPQIIGTLKTLAPQAQLIVLNLYNPFNSLDPLYTAFDPLISEINQRMSSNATLGYTVADVYTKFKTTPGAVNFNLAMKQLDPHPTTVGHAAIYQSILDAFPKTSAVTRLAGLTRVDTALEIAKASYTGKLTNVILATADNYPDALAGSVLAYKLKAPILLVGSTEAEQAKVLAYLKANLDTTGTVTILGGTGVVGANVDATLSASGFTHITRLDGADRYETALKIADQLGVKTGTPVVLVYGENYPDALSISSIAAGAQCPILLVQNAGLSDAMKKELAAIQPTKVYIIGGEGVISANVASQVAEITSLAAANIVRLGGADRYATSLAVAKYFNLSGPTICVATGNNFPDALAGSVYAAQHAAPIILADGSLSEQVLNYLKTGTLTGATLFGGEGVVSKTIELQLEQLMS